MSASLRGEAKWQTLGVVGVGPEADSHTAVGYCSSTEYRFRQTLDPDIDREDAAHHRRRRESRLVHEYPAAVVVLGRGRRDEERVHVGAAEGAAGDVLHGNRDLAIDAA